MRIQGLSDAYRASHWFSRLLIRLRGSDGVSLGSMPLLVLLCCCDVLIMRPLTVKVNNNLSTLTVCDILIASILGISAKPKLAKVIRASDRQNRVDGERESPCVQERAHQLSFFLLFSCFRN